MVTEYNFRKKKKYCKAVYLQEKYNLAFDNKALTWYGKEIALVSNSENTNDPVTSGKATCLLFDCQRNCMKHSRGWEWVHSLLILKGMLNTLSNGLPATAHQQKTTIVFRGLPYLMHTCTIPIRFSGKDTDQIYDTPASAQMHSSSIYKKANSCT